jgi:hypothetical protein
MSSPNPKETSNGTTTLPTQPFLPTSNETDVKKQGIDVPSLKQKLQQQQQHQHQQQQQVANKFAWVTDLEKQSLETLREMLWSYNP